MFFVTEPITQLCQSLSWGFRGSPTQPTTICSMSLTPYEVLGEKIQYPTSIC